MVIGGKVGDVVDAGKRWLYSEGRANEYKGHSKKEITGGTVYFFRGTVEKNKKSVRCMIVVDDDGTVHAPERLSGNRKKHIGRIIRQERARMSHRVPCIQTQAP